MRIRQTGGTGRFVKRGSLEGGEGGEAVVASPLEVGHGGCFVLYRWIGLVDVCRGVRCVYVAQRSSTNVDMQDQR